MMAIFMYNILYLVLKFVLKLGATVAELLKATPAKLIFIVVVISLSSQSRL